MAISLANLQRGGTPRPPRLLIYATKGLGKSTLAASAPSPVFLDIEDGLTSLDVPAFPIKSFGDAMDAIGVLYSEPHDFRTVVIDSLDWLEPLIWSDVCAAHKVDHIEKVEKGFGKGYAIAVSLWAQVLDGLNALRDERGMTVILLAHPKIKKFDSPETEPYDRYQLKLNDHASSKVQEHVDAILFGNYRISTVKSDSGFNKKAVRAVGAGDRVLYTSERPAFAAKNRYGMPDQLPLEWSAIAECIPFFNTAA